jgi:hypothetical protein
MTHRLCVQRQVVQHGDLWESREADRAPQSGEDAALSERANDAGHRPMLLDIRIGDGRVLRSTRQNDVRRLIGRNVLDDSIA